MQRTIRALRKTLFGKTSSQGPPGPAHRVPANSPKRPRTDSTASQRSILKRFPGRVLRGKKLQRVSRVCERSSQDFSSPACREPMVLPGLSPPGNALATGPLVGDRQVRHGKQRESRSVFAGAIFSCDLPENDRDLPLEIVDLPEKNCDHTEKTGDFSEKSAVQAGKFADRAEKNQDLPKNHDPSDTHEHKHAGRGRKPPKKHKNPSPRRG